VLLHGQDVAVPLGIDRPMPTAVAVAVAGHLFGRRGNLEFRTRRRAAGLRLRATNAAWERGDGVVAEAPIEAILLAFTGRAVGAASFDGPGADLVRRRTTPGS
jgi:hypothetical protein